MIKWNNICVLASTLYIYTNLLRACDYRRWINYSSVALFAQGVGGDVFDWLLVDYNHLLIELT